MRLLQLANKPQGGLLKCKNLLNSNNRGSYPRLVCSMEGFFADGWMKKMFKLKNVL